MYGKLVGALLTAGALVVVPSPAGAAGSGGLLLDGIGGSHAEVVLTRPTRLRYAAMTWRGCGAVRGFFLAPVDRAAATGVGAVDFEAFEVSGVARLPVLLGMSAAGFSPRTEERVNGVAVPAGRYRAHLIGTGQCEVRVPGAKGTGLNRVKPTQPTRFVATTETLPEVAPGSGIRTARGAATVDVRDETLTVLIHHLAWREHPVVPVDGDGGTFFCVRDTGARRGVREQVCEPHSYAGSATQMSPTPDSTGAHPAARQVWSFHVPGQLYAGPYEASVVPMRQPDPSVLHEATAVLVVDL